MFQEIEGKKVKSRWCSVSVGVFLFSLLLLLLVYYKGCSLSPLSHSYILSSTCLPFTLLSLSYSHSYLIFSLIHTILYLKISWRDCAIEYRVVLRSRSGNSLSYRSALLKIFDPFFRHEPSLSLSLSSSPHIFSEGHYSMSGYHKPLLGSSEDDSDGPKASSSKGKSSSNKVSLFPSSPSSECSSS